ncbi:hypothetical protein EYB25_002950 [Talaromyces marneffei]|nr:hypothetical protein EYB25_002950 [Talaromyces marneffei]
MNETRNNNNITTAANNNNNNNNNNDKPINPRSRIFRPCLTCRRRKISCDKTRPKCKRCAQTGYQCEGYGEERHFVYVIPTRSATPSDSSDSSQPSNRSNSISNKDSHNSKKVTLRSSRQLPPDHLQQQIWKPQTAQLRPPRLSRMMTLNSSDVNRLQMVSYFIDRYMPDRMAQRTENITAMTWLMGLPNLLGKWKILDMSLSALSLAYIGDMHGNKQTSRQGEHFYNQALQHMRGQLARNQIDEGMLAACICMSIYEIFHTSEGGTSGWMFHVKGACRLLELRGPPSPSSPLDMNLFRRIRAVALWDSYASGKTSFLAKPEWRGLSDTPYDLLLDILVRLTGLLSKAEHIDSMAASGLEAGATAAAQKLMWKCHALRDDLVTWYADFQTKETGPLFYLEPEEQHPYLDPDSDLNDIFPDSVTFQTPYIAQLLLLYWYGEVVVHSAMSTAHRHLWGPSPSTETPSPASSSSPSTTSSVTTERLTEARQQMTMLEGETLANIETIGEYFAAKICQAMAGIGRNSLRGYGFQIGMVPLWSAQQYYLNRSSRKYMWCRTVLMNFGRKGFVVGQSLGALAYRQYPGRYVGNNTSSSIEELIS